MKEDLNKTKIGSNEFYTHIIIDSRNFTLGYIRFMNINMNNYKHIFFVICSDKKRRTIYEEEPSVICLKSYRSLILDRKCKKILKACNKIIFSGAHDVLGMASLGRKNLSKTYLQFWGGDFYCLREHQPFYNPRYYLNRLRLYYFSRCMAAVFLLNTEYEKFREITGIEKRHFVGSMPSDPTIEYDYSESPAISKRDPSKIRIVVGNSAFRENQHIEVFHILKKWKNKIEVLCPLSYGEDEYKAYVLKEGKVVLGDAFIPILDYMDMQEYIYHLATCDVAIYNNNRQQAMGNITIMTCLKKKVFIRSDTSMWSQFKENGFILHDAKKIGNLSFDEFIFQSEEEKQENLDVLNKTWYNPESWVKQWTKIFEDEI